MAKKKAFFNWSSGKDSALALHEALLSERYSVEALFTVMRADDAAVSMHETPERLVRAQANAIGIPLVALKIDPAWSAAEYGHAVKHQVDAFKEAGFTCALFGDLYLEDLRRTREKRLAASGFEAAFPLWGMAPEHALRAFIGHGFKAVTTCIDGEKLPERLIGRTVDERFIEELPHGVDICGENGEHHSFVYDGPLFKRPVSFEVARTFGRSFPNADGTPHRYWYAQLA